MDALSDALRVMSLTGAVFLDAECTAPWCVSSHADSATLTKLTGSPDIVFFHVLTEGRCQARLVSGGPVLDLAAGDLLMLVLNRDHLMGSDLQRAPVRSDSIVKPGEDGMLRISHGGGGAKTRFVCGYLRCDRRL